MDQEGLMFLAISLLVAAVVLLSSGASGPLSAITLLLSVLAMVLIVIIYFADFLVFPMFTKIFGITIIPSKNYWIPKGQDAVVKYINGLYYATGYLTANIYNYVFAQEEISEEEQNAMAAAPERWERAVMSINFPFKFNIATVSQEIQKYREELEGQRGLLQFQYSKELNQSNANPMSLQEIERRINVIQARIDRLGEGERPVNTLLYIETTAVGVSEKDALDALTNQLNQLQIVFNGFDLSITRVLGRELYLLFKLNYVVPGLQELNSMFQSQR